MVQPRTADAAAEAGLGENLRSLFASMLAYFQARLQLAGLESKEALSHYLKVLALLAAALTGLLFGYILLCISIALLLSRWFGLHFMWALLGLALAHFLLAAVCGIFVVKRVSLPMFRATLSELRKDQEWLNNPRPS